MSAMSYADCFPSDRDDQLNRVIELAKGFSGLTPMTIVAAGMGSGKSRVMAALLKAIGSSIIYVLTPNDRIGNQLKKAIIKWIMLDTLGPIVIVDGNDKNSHTTIRAATTPVVVFFSCLKKAIASKMNTTTHHFLKYLEEFKDRQQLALIDELDLHLTQLTGGINSKVSHHEGIIMGPHMALINYQANSSLNIFDSIRAAGAKCIGFSGTFNNMICSKLPSMGYQENEITLVNVAPIKSLYWHDDGTPKTTIIHDNVTIKEGKKILPNKVVLVAFFNKVEASDGKGLITCSTNIQMEEVISLYERIFGKKMERACITGKSKPDDLTIANAKYIIGMKLVGTGLDLSTLAEGCQFSHGILLSKLSDKESNPLAKNLEHLLRMEVSSSFLQLIARLREGGTFVVPKAFDAVNSLGAALEKIFEINRDGRSEMQIVGTVRSDQLGRYYQGILLAIVQNLRYGMENMFEEERPVVEGILTELELFDGRSIKTEYNAYKSGGAFDHEYWIKTIELLWSVYLERFTNAMDDKTFESKKLAMIDAAKIRAPRVVIRGNGTRDGRQYDEREAELVRARAQGKCAHCGDVIKPTDTIQICHVDRCDMGGSFTADNLVWGHVDCDGNYDAHRLIHCPGGGVYLSKRSESFCPDMKQWSGISAENIQKRWNWVMSKMNITNSNAFKEYLKEDKYVFIPA